MKALASDNNSGIHPEILKAIAQINEDQGHEHSYGLDDTSKRLEKIIHNIFGPEYDWFHVFNGTAANVLSLKALIKSHESVFCNESSHLNVDECGAPEFNLGCKIITLPDNKGKIQLEDLKNKLIRYGDQHYSQPKALSITQPTELGTCYSMEELKLIKDFCKENKLLLHIDGARLSNASYTLKTSLKKIISGADAVSFGGTKNGLMVGEIVLLKKNHSKNFKFTRKQLMQLPSKTRFLSEQFITYFSNDLYLKIAKHSCDLANLLHDSIKNQINLTPRVPTESNAVFVRFPKSVINPLKKKFFFYVWDSKTFEETFEKTFEETFEVRLMTSFDSTKDEILEFIKTLKELMPHE